MEVVELVVRVHLDGTRLQVDQALAQGPQAEKGGARKKKACRRRSKTWQQPTTERITHFGRCPFSWQHNRAGCCRVLAERRQARRLGLGFYVSQRGRTAISLPCSRRTTFQRFAGKSQTTTSLCLPHRTTFNVSRLSGFGARRSLDLGACGLDDPRERRPTRHPVQVSVRTRRAARASLATWSAN